MYLTGTYQTRSVGVEQCIAHKLEKEREREKEGCGFIVVFSLLSDICPKQLRSIIIIEFVDHKSNKYIMLMIM